MLFSTRGQFLELLACIFGGIVIGIIYDILHFFYYGAPDKSFEKRLDFMLADILFVLFSAAVFIVVTYLSSFGQVRGYTFLGFLLGFLSERYTIKKFVAKAARAVYNYFSKIKTALKARHAEKQKLRAKLKPKKLKKARKNRKRGNDRITV